jgi:hypothetical protein
MRPIALGWAVLLFAAVGCGSSNSSSATCDNIANAFASLPGKYSACGTIPSGSLNFDKNQCVTAFNNSSCSDADRQKINDYANCLSALPNCTTATQAAWVTSLTDCESKLSGISSNC